MPIGELDRHWGYLKAAQRAKAERQAAAVAAAADLIDGPEQVRVKDAFEEAAEAAEGMGWHWTTLRDLYYGGKGREGVRHYPRIQWPQVLATRSYGGGAEAWCDPTAWAAWKKDYLRREEPTLEQTYRRLRGLADENGWRIPKSSKTLHSRLYREMHPAAIALARQGPDAVKRMFPAQIRDKTSLRPMDLVCADGHTIRSLVRWPDGKVERPTLTAWMDVRSARVVSWRIDRTESSDSYRLAMMDLVREHGVPGGVLLDNSSAAAAISLTGGCHWRHKGGAPDEDELMGLITQLVGPKNVHWALPYSAQSKPIERSFKDIGPEIAQDPRLRGAYVGPHPAAKPRYGSGPKPEKAEPVELAVLLVVVEHVIREHNSRSGRRGQGLNRKSFDEVWSEGLTARVDDPPARLSTAQLERWLLAPKKVVASAKLGEVKLYEGRYWSEELCRALAGRSTPERTVVVRHDPDHLDQPVIVEDREGRLIARAKPWGKTPYLDSREARETARDQGKLRKLAREQLEVQNRMSDRDYARLLNDAAKDEGPEPEPIEQRKVVSAAFGVRAAPRNEAVATGTDNVVELLTGGGRGPVNDAENVALPEETEEENWVDYLTDI